MADALPVLYSFRRCPYAMRARLAINISRYRCELREVVLKDKPQSMLDASPKGTVPVLIEAGGTVVEESLAVMHHVLSLYDPDDWLQHDEETTMGLIAECDTGFVHHLNRYKYADWHEDADPIEHRDKAGKFLEKLESRLSRHKYLFGETLSFADAAIFPLVRQFTMPDQKWWQNAAPYPNVRAWVEGITDSSLFTSSMKKYAQWKEGDPPTCFPQQGEDL